MHMLSVTAALVLSVIAGILTTSAVLLPDSVARASLQPRAAMSAEPCGDAGSRVYIDTLGEPVAIGCLPPLDHLDSPAPALW